MQENSEMDNKNMTDLQLSKFVFEEIKKLRGQLYIQRKHDIIFLIIGNS